MDQDMVLMGLTADMVAADMEDMDTKAVTTIMAGKMNYT